MKPYILSFLLLVFCMVSCKNQTTEIISSKNDTTEVIKFAIRKAFYHHSLPEDDALVEKYYFKDSILFTTDSLPFECLPTSVDSISFKILPKDQICRLITADSIDGNQPNYLYIGYFNKQDSIYNLTVASQSCIPYGGSGIFGIEVLKRGDSLIILHKGSSSIN